MAPVNGYFAYHVDLGTGIQAITPAFGTGSRAAAGGKRYWSLYWGSPFPSRSKPNSGLLVYSLSGQNRQHEDLGM